MSVSRYIISDHRFHEHQTLAEAEAEANRLRAIHPGKRFRVYKIKWPLDTGHQDKPPRPVVQVGDHDAEPMVSA